MFIVIPDEVWFLGNVALWVGFYLFARWLKQRKNRATEEEGMARPSPRKKARINVPSPTGKRAMVSIKGRKYELVEARFGNVVKTAVRERRRDGTFGVAATYRGTLKKVSTRMVGEAEFAFPADIDHEDIAPDRDDECDLSTGIGMMAER